MALNQSIKQTMNQQEFMKIVNPFRDKVFRLARRLLVSVEEAEDATQEVMVKDVTAPSIASAEALRRWP